MKIALLLALIAGDEWTDAKKAAEAAAKNPDPAAREAAAAKLAAFDRKEAVDLLLDLWATGTRVARDLQAQKAEKIQKMDAMPIKKKLQGGSVTLVGDEVKQKQDFDALDADIKALEDKLLAEDKVRWKVREILGKFSSAEAGKMLASKLAGEPDWSARGAAAEALGGLSDPEAKPALRKALPREKDPRAVMSIAEAIGRQRDVEAVPDLASAFKKADDWAVRAAIVKALRAIGDPKVIEPLIDMLKGLDGRLKDDVNSALVALTGVDKHGDHAAWKDFFQTNKDALLGGGYKKPEGGPKGEAGATTFYGIPVTSKKVLFILDRSGSMAEKASVKQPSDTPTGPGQGGNQGKPAGDRKIDVARWELKNCILGLKKDVRFNVIFYNHEYMIWQETGLADASDENKRRAVEFVEKLQPEGQTNIYDPVEKGFLISDGREKDPKKQGSEMDLFKNGVDTIYLMSDGMPNNGRITDPGQIVAKVTEMNKARKITIHTVAVGDQIKEDFMKSLAEQNGGKFVHRK